jgi:hypothetical protein
MKQTDRFADRDMTMRYYWGLGVGHTYAHGTRESVPADENLPEDDDGVEDDTEELLLPVAEASIAQDSITVAELDPGSPAPSDIVSESEDAASDLDLEERSDSEEDSEERSDSEEDSEEDSDSSEEGSIDEEEDLESEEDMYE